MFRRDSRCCCLPVTLGVALVPRLCRLSTSHSAVIVNTTPELGQNLRFFLVQPSYRATPSCRRQTAVVEFTSRTSLHRAAEPTVRARPCRGPLLDGCARDFLSAATDMFYTGSLDTERVLSCAVQVATSLTDNTHDEDNRRNYRMALSRAHTSIRQGR